VNHQNESLITEDALDLLDQMLRYDHDERTTPKDAMEHPYFKPIKDQK
jgi:casein kinase II subunit alpha